jgi:hypothetical protein
MKATSPDYGDEDHFIFLLGLIIAVAGFFTGPR